MKNVVITFAHVNPRFVHGLSSEHSCDRKLPDPVSHLVFYFLESWIVICVWFGDGEILRDVGSESATRRNVVEIRLWRRIQTE